jgi:hypothetical protein
MTLLFKKSQIAIINVVEIQCHNLPQRQLDGIFLIPEKNGDVVNLATNRARAFIEANGIIPIHRSHEMRNGYDSYEADTKHLGDIDKCHVDHLKEANSALANGSRSLSKSKGSKA